LKETNLLNLCKYTEDKILRFGVKTRKKILASVHRDVELLSRFDLMDYSLLICIEEVDEQTEVLKWSDHRRRTMYLSENKQYIYHISIIDFLQDYNAAKVCENLFKNAKESRRKRNTMSCVPSELYGKRFENFMA